MKQINTLLILILLVNYSCINDRNINKIEVISYRWGVIDSLHNQKFSLYTEIEKNGNCKMLKYNYKTERNEFQSFKMNKDLFKNFINTIDTINHDTILSEPISLGTGGFEVRILKHTKYNKIISILFLTSFKSNKKVASIENYLDSISRKNKCCQLTFNFDTAELLKKRNKILKDLAEGKIKIIGSKINTGELSLDFLHHAD